MKKNMKRFSLVILSACLLFSLIACATVKHDYTALSEKAQTIADTIVSDYGSTSVQYAVIDSGKIILSGGSGVYSLTDNRSVTKDDMYGIGSSSKMYVTAAAMTLVDKGLLDIDRPLIDYIPEFKMADERYKEITTRMLMNHSSGIYGTGYCYNLLFDDPDTTYHDNLLEQLAVQNLKSDPGELFIYCNDGFTLLEILVERLSGMSYTEFLAKNFCEPLGLTHTKTPQNAFDRAKLVRTYSPLYDGAMPSDTLNAMGTGGLYSTAEELCLFSEVLMGNKQEILSENSAALMLNEEYKNSIWQTENKDALSYFGLGWDTVHCYPFGDYDIQCAGKSGCTMLFFSYIMIIPEYDIAMAVTSSGGDIIINCAFASSILQELLLQKGIIKQLSPQRTFEAPVQTEIPEAFAKYSGLYATASSQLDIRVKDGVLSVVSSNSNMKFVHVGDGVFKSGDGSTSVEFVELSDGNVYLQKHSFLTFPGVGQGSLYSLMAQKITPATLPQAILDSWNKRAGMKYYCVNDKSTSQTFLTNSEFAFMKMNDSFENGYAFAGTRITDENHAVNILKLRDVLDFSFFTKDGAEYLISGDLVYIREDAISKLTAETTCCTLDADGYSKYYNVGSDVAGKTMSVKMPEVAAYVVYDENNVCVDFSTVSHNTEAVLPAGGKVIFIGEAGNAFGIELQ